VPKLERRQDFPPEAAKIRAGFVAFAAGDAFGAPWEGMAPEEVAGVDLSQLPPREDWPRGATSDDTAQLILAAEALCAAGDLQREFMERLAVEFPRMRGVGPTTAEAVRRWRESGSLGVTSATTNGAAMRALAVGWGAPREDPEARREMVLALSRATHGAPGAQVAAGVVAALADWSLEGRPIRSLWEDAVAEAARLREILGVDIPLDNLAAAADGAWAPPVGGVSLDAMETAAAVLHVLREAEGLSEGVEASIRLGGDTDTVAAIVGGILGTRDEGPEETLPWLPLVRLPDPVLLDRLAAGLWGMRGGRADWSS
jgi:ADP-ribosyl-[dinitrogen reductase] hydrolase